MQNRQLAIFSKPKLGVKMSRFDVNLRVSNALNADYRDYLNRFRYYADDQGRNISLKVSYSI